MRLDLLDRAFDSDHPQEEHPEITCAVCGWKAAQPVQLWVQLRLKIASSESLFTTDCIKFHLGLPPKCSCARLRLCSLCTNKPIRSFLKRSAYQPLFFTLVLLSRFFYHLCHSFRHLAQALIPTASSRSFLTMLSRYAVSWLAVMASTAAGGSVLRAADTSSIAPTANTTLSPVPNQNATGSTPSTSVQLNWGTNDTTAAIVQVSLAMNYSSVVLEDIPDVSSVDCDDTSVSVTFSTQNEFDAMQTSWSALADHFVMITNHVGDCDAEFERGFFLADVETLSFDSNSLTVRASVEKTDISSTSSKYIADAVCYLS